MASKQDRKSPAGNMGLAKVGLYVLSISFCAKFELWYFLNPTFAKPRPLVAMQKRTPQ
jgi:hypothetical protein